MFPSRTTNPEDMAIAGRPRHELPARDVLIVADWTEIPQALRFPGSGLRAELACCERVSEALDLVLRKGAALDVVVVDSDAFGDPETAADFCFALRRLAPFVRILALASELWEDDGLLSDLGACDAFLPPAAGPLRLYEALLHNSPCA